MRTSQRSLVDIGEKNNGSPNIFLIIPKPCHRLSWIWERIFAEAAPLVLVCRNCGNNTSDANIWWKHVTVKCLLLPVRVIANNCLQKLTDCKHSNFVALWIQANQFIVALTLITILQDYCALFGRGLHTCDHILLTWWYFIKTANIA